VFVPVLEPVEPVDMLLPVEPLDVLLPVEPLDVLPVEACGEVEPVVQGPVGVEVPEPPVVP
jgi:hypothetical protein